MLERKEERSKDVFLVFSICISTLHDVKIKFFWYTQWVHTLKRIQWKYMKPLTKHSFPPVLDTSTNDIIRDFFNSALKADWELNMLSP
jgi:hypothetical protein